jgi:hypothetical protein
VIHHWTFSADDPKHVAAVLAEIVGGHVIEPPRPPYGADSIWVCLFDEHGTMLEIARTGTVWVPHETAPAAEGDSEDKIPQYSYNHAFLGSPLSFDRIAEICSAQGWRTVVFDDFIKMIAVWVENKTYLEFCPDEDLGLYLAAYGPSAKEATIAQSTPTDGVKAL